MDQHGSPSTAQPLPPQPPGQIPVEPSPQVDPGEYLDHPHALIMVGNESLFACHMTSLWMLGHTYQLVLRVHVPYDVMRRYREAVSATPTAADRARYFAPSTCFLTNDREFFPLPEFALGRRTFLGDFYRGFPKHFQGWPWGDEKPIVDRFPVEVERVVYFRHFDYNARYPHSQSYLLFGERSEAHLYHLQTHEIDYDQMATLQSAPEWLHPSRLRVGAQINFPALPGGVTTCANPLGEGRRWKVQYQGTGIERDIIVGRTHWYSTAVTNSPGAMPCPDPTSEPLPGNAVTTPPHVHSVSAHS